MIDTCEEKCLDNYKTTAAAEALLFRNVKITKTQSALRNIRTAIQPMPAISTNVSAHTHHWETSKAGPAFAACALLSMDHA